MLFVLEDDVDVYNYADDNSFVCSSYDYDYVNLDKFQCIVFGRNKNLLVLI